MRLLLINTCGSEGLAALADTALPEPIVAEARLPGRSTSESLMPAVARLFRQTGWTVPDLGAIAVVDGPGSFTGVRVGLSAAKGLCESNAIPMIAISRLALVAAKLRDTTSGAPSFDSITIKGWGGLSGSANAPSAALLDAGRNEFFLGLYTGSTCEYESLISRDQAIALTIPRITCEPRVAEALTGQAIQLIPEPDATSILAFALKRIEAADWTDTATIDARYLRRTDAELLLDRRNAVAG